jgi:hypothetical protein
MIRAILAEYSVTPVLRMAGIDEVSHKMTYALRLLRCVRSLMALSRHARRVGRCPLMEVKRTRRVHRERVDSALLIRSRHARIVI